MTDTERFDRLATLYNLTVRNPNVDTRPIVTAMANILGVNIGG